MQAAAPLWGRRDREEMGPRGLFTGQYQHHRPRAHKSGPQALRPWCPDGGTGTLGKRGAPFWRTCVYLVWLPEAGSPPEGLLELPQASDA